MSAAACRGSQPSHAGIAGPTLVARLEHTFTGHYDHVVRTWSLHDLTLTRLLNGHSGTVWSVAFSPDGTQVASGGEDQTVRIWRALDGAPLRTLEGHTLNVWSVRFSPDGQLV